MPTKQEIENYFEEDTQRTVLKASKHFNVEPQNIWDILNGKK